MSERDEAVTRLGELIGLIPARLQEVEIKEYEAKPDPKKWSKKEVLGHLIDSATNNLNRFIRSQVEDTPHIVYDQDEWVLANKYQRLNEGALIHLWFALNLHIHNLVSLFEEVHWKQKCQWHEEEPRDLEFIFVDYVRHLEHHMKQIVDYES